MFLKSVKARGFKSFARPVEFGFEPGITVVVGPNGSGKSNIADSVMWAMGEQSPSAVRGASMQDVIFSGSDKLPPAGMAEVELVFDNGKGILPIEFSEVAVSRRLYRDGEGAYFINRSPCRLLDVAELLSDAGLWKGTHIVSQGRVEAILESRPEERRGYIEEAAGLGKFKKRRHRAGLKLAAVRRNLDRLSDVEEELKSKARPLKRQATAAERSTRLRQQSAEAETRLLKGKLALLARRLEKADAAIAEADAERQNLERQITEAAAMRRQTEELLSASLKQHKQMTASFYQLRSGQDNLSGRQSELKQRLGVLKEAGKKAALRKDNLQGQLSRLRSELAQARSKRETAMSSIEKTDADLAGKLAQLERVEEEIARRRQASEVKNRRRSELAALKEKYNLQLEYLSERREKLAAAAERSGLESQDRRRQLELIEEQTRARQAQMDERRHRAAEAEVRLNRISAGLREVDKSRAEAETSLRRVNEDLRIAKARLTFIAGNDQERAGLSPAAKKLSQKSGIPAVMDLIEVEPGYEQAAAVVLNEVLFALVVQDLNQARELLEEAISANLGGLDIVTPPAGPAAPGNDGDCLINHVTIPARWTACLAPFLKGVRVAGSIEEISERVQATKKDDDRQASVWVTKDGVIYRPGQRLLSYRSQLPASLVMKHRNEQRLLERERNRAKQLFRELESRLAEIERERERLREKTTKSEADLGRSWRERDDAEAAAAAAQRQKKVLQHEVELKDGARRQLLAEQEALEEEMGRAAARLGETESSLREISACGSDGGDNSDEALVAARLNLSQKTTEHKIEAAQMRERAQVAAQAEERLQSVLTGQKSELEGALFQMDACGRLEPACSLLLEKMGRLTDLYRTATGGLEERLARGEQLAEQHSASLGKLSTLEAGLQQKLAGAGKKGTDREVDAARLREQAAELSSRLDGLYERFPEAGPAETEAAAESDLEEAEAHLDRLARRLELIGPVNPLAQQEYEELLERQQFLAGQRADLESSLKELTGLIAELTSRIEKSFNDTFAAVRDHFADVVSTLFPGGKGQLELTSPLRDPEAGDEEAPEAGGSFEEEADDDYSAGDRRGIEISIKPARKAARSLSLLSGGERSLVAVAFLFAIFLARPAPFYILDEIEAALDDVNITRLLNMIGCYQDKTQFIVITHQKRTMECADVLYGVSMGADGTSKVLSRRMDKTATAAGEAEAEREAGRKEAEAALAG